MRAVAFDAMGVLYRSADDVADLLIPFIRAHGASLAEEEIRAIYRRAYVGELTSQDPWQQLGVEGSAAELDTAYVSDHEVTPGILDLIDELRGQGLLVGCISNDVAEWSWRYAAGTPSTSASPAGRSAARSARAILMSGSTERSSVLQG